MSRRRRATKRSVTPDHKYESTLVTKLVNRIMKDGKKTKAESIVYKALDHLQEKTGNCLATLELAKENARPKTELKSVRLGGTNISIPMNVGASRSESLMMSWIAKIVKKHKAGRPAFMVLGGLLLDASKSQGQLVKRKEDNHKMAEANKAYANQYRNF